MKKIIVLFLLSAFLLQSTGKLYTLVSFYINQDYISQTVCINRFDAIPICKGNCFLSEQLEKKDKKEQHFPDLNQKDFQLFYENNAYWKFAHLVFIKSEKPIYPMSSLACSTFLFSVFHPPEAI